MDKQIFDPFVATAEPDAIIDFLRHENLMLASRNQKLRQEINDFQKKLAAIATDCEELQKTIDRLNREHAAAQGSAMTVASVPSEAEAGKS